MENFKQFEKWYETHVIDNSGENVFVNIENLPDYGWRVHINFKNTNYKHPDSLYESKKISDFNYYEIKADGKEFEGKGDFTKLDFLFGKFLYYIGKSEVYTYERDFFSVPEIQNFIFENHESDYVFLHYTSEKTFAESIIKNGFRFTAFDKTTSKVNNDSVDLNYNHIIRKPFGNYVAVIRISKKIYDKYLNLINKAGEKTNLKVEELLSKEKAYNEELGEFVYTLHNKYVKGFFNYRTGLISENPDFDSNFDSDDFIKKAEDLQ